jgi:hypothetical protein
VKKTIALIIIMLLVLGASGCTKKGKSLNLKLYFVEETTTESQFYLLNQNPLQENQDISTRDITAKTTIGHIYANDPLAEFRTWYAEAEVFENGIKLENPVIKWNTNFEGIALVPLHGRTDIVRIQTSQYTPRGRGLIMAEYQEEIATMPVIAYGFFSIDNNTGWNFQEEKAVGHEESDLYFAFHSQSYFMLYAPYGIKKVGTFGMAEKAFFEKIENPTENDFVNEIRLEMGDIHEIIDKNGNHYKLAVLGGSWNVYQDGTEKNVLDVAWDTFTK